MCPPITRDKVEIDLSETNDVKMTVAVKIVGTHFVNTIVMSIFRSLHQSGKIFWFCFVSSFFFCKVIFVLRLIEKLKSALQCFREIIWSFDPASWKNHMFRNNRHFHLKVCYPFSLETVTLAWTKLLQMVYVSQVVVYLSKINGFAFPARNYCLWNFKNLQNIKK